MCVQAILQIYQQQPIAGATERVTGAGVGGAPGGAQVSHQVAQRDTSSLLVTETSRPLDKFLINGLELGLYSTLPLILGHGSKITFSRCSWPLAADLSSAEA